MKICSTCRESKSLEEFSRDKSRKDGLDPRCKKCYQKKNKIQYAKNMAKESPEAKDRRLSLKREWRNNNLERVYESNRQYYIDNKPKVLNKTLKYVYQITLEQYNQMLEEQDYVCAICKQPNATGKALSVDHDHSCCPGVRSCGECVRALLCFRCNTGLGHFRDDEKHLEEALNYIRKYKPTN